MESAFWEGFFEWCAICHSNKDTELESENRKQFFTWLRKYSMPEKELNGPHIIKI